MLIEGRALRLLHPALRIAMAGGCGPAVCVLPMGSPFEGAGDLQSDIMILKLRALLRARPEALRANHSNLE